jgi:hypothetical protein
MSATDQLTYVEKLLSDWKKTDGFADDQKLEGGQLYAMVFLPAYANNADGVLCQSGSKYYSSNSGLDADGDGSITIDDLSKRVQAKYQELYNAWT